MQAMKTDTDRMRWAVTFAETNVLALTERDLRRVRRELAAFLAGHAEDFPVTVHVVFLVTVHDGPRVAGPLPSIATLSGPELHRLREETYGLLRAAAIGRGSATAEVGQLQVDVVRPRGKPREMRIGGAVHDAYIMSLALLLATDVGRNVARCPECGAIFVKVRRQLYCAAKCTDRATWRNYPAAKKRRARERQYAKHGWTVGARTDAKEKKR